MGIYYYGVGLPKKPPARQPWRAIFRSLMTIIALLGIIGMIGYVNDKSAQIKIAIPVIILTVIYLLLSLYWFFCVKDPFGKEQKERKAREISESAENEPDSDDYMTFTIGDDGKIKDLKIPFRDPSALSQATPHASDSSSDASADADAPPSSSAQTDRHDPTEEEAPS